jgi:hypothetical protein
MRSIDSPVAHRKSGKRVQFGLLIRMGKKQTGDPFEGAAGAAPLGNRFSQIFKVPIISVRSIGDSVQGAGAAGVDSIGGVVPERPTVRMSCMDRLGPDRLIQSAGLLLQIQN